MEQALTPELCRDYLRVVIDPEIYQNIVDLGLVYGIEVKNDGSVDVAMTLTTPHCPLGPQIIGDVEKTLLSKGASDVVVRLVWEPMWTPDAMTDELKRELGILADDDGTGMGATSETASPTGVVENDPDDEPELEIEPPPPPKKNWLGRLFGF